MPTTVWSACEPWSDQAADNLEPQALRIGKISLNVNDVFNDRNENENQWIHRFANRAHIQSRESLIRAQLLFATGDVFDAELLAETARNLRRNSYLRRATVSPLQVCSTDNAIQTVDILVETGDNWSLTPTFNFSRAGGENEFEFGLSESNLFGLGKSIGILLDYGRVREQRVLQYFDPMLLGSKTQLTAQLQDNTDGEVQFLKLAQPFSSLDTKRSWQAQVGNYEYKQNLYDDGLTVAQLSVDNEFITVQRGMSKGKKLVSRKPNGDAIYRVARWSAGWHFDRLRLSPTAISPDAQPIILPGTESAPERIFSYPFIELSLLQPAFIEQSNLQLMESVEDVNLGHTLRTRLGFAAGAFSGDDKNALRAELQYEKGWQHGDRILTLFDAKIDGYYATDSGIEDGSATATLEGFYFFSQKSRFFASANAVSTAGLYANRQVVIGGKTGLRGYPLNFQTGSRRAKLTLEQRYFFNWYPLRLARLGSAAFFDVGSVWDKGEDPQWLSDVGFGLRVVGTRQSNAKVLHIDLAFPLNETDRIDAVQLVVSAKTQF